jgi:NTE family protein
LSRGNCDGLDGSIDFFVLPPLCPLVESPHDFCQTSDLIEMAATSTEAGIAAGGLDRPGVLAQLGTHEHAS